MTTARSSLSCEPRATDALLLGSKLSLLYTTRLNGSWVRHALKSELQTDFRSCLRSQ